jgi:hypothetical protein
MASQIFSFNSQTNSLLFHSCFVPVFLARVISSLAYLNLFGNKRLSCCGYSQTKDCVPVSLIQSLQEIVIAKFILVGCISNELIYARAFESNHI